jgi:hypothetical protein
MDGRKKIVQDDPPLPSIIECSPSLFLTASSTRRLQSASTTVFQSAREFAAALNLRRRERP